MKHITWRTHRRNLDAGLKVVWERTADDWFVVCYSDGSRWLFDDDAQTLELLGTVSDGLAEAEILETDSGAIIALYADGPQAFADREAWIESLSEADKKEAARILAESETGEITEIHVSDFTPAPEFDERWFESKIGAFPGALTGTQDAAAALDEFRS